MNADSTSSQMTGLIAENATIMIFGASGDLTARKLIPALYKLWRSGYLPEKTQIVGVARRDKTDDTFRQEMRDAIAKHKKKKSLSDASWNDFGKRLFYCRLDISESEDFPKMRERVEQIEKDAGLPGNRVVYLATAPSLFLPSVQALSEAEMIPDPSDEQWLRVVIEKPFGTDYKSACELSQSLGKLLAEEQIYRIDHYLGKETVQNILLFRFGNSIFEPLLNRNHVDHVQITVAESQGMERGRGGYYDQSGALRDVLQNHLLQLLCLVAMEPPALFRGEEIRNEKLKILQTLTPGNAHEISDWAVAGQYTEAEINGLFACGYRDEERIPEGSKRETFIAMEAYVDNWRWAGVPFYLRTGKRMPKRLTEIAIQFKQPPLHLFSTVECEGDICDLVGAKPNQLIFRIQPHEAISMICSTKRPGMQYQIHPVEMDFEYQDEFAAELPEAYERLLLDVLRGDSTLFTRSDELEMAWEFVTPVLEEIEKEDAADPEFYPAGTWGPTAAHRLLHRTGRQWREP